MTSGGDFRLTEEMISASTVCSYDPNEKHVYPEDTIGVDTTLTYHIDFQNVGNDTAFDIIVTDTLHQNLDITTLELGATSHDYDFDISGRELIWTFDNILLPDSTVDEPGSHGFVEYRVKPLSTLPVGTTIENKAGIYFDLNPPVITNTVVNTIGAVGVNEERLSASPGRFTLQQNYPNPFKDETLIRYALPGSGKTHVLLQVYDSAGRLVKTIVNGDKEPGYHLAGWTCEDRSGRGAAAGVYFYRLTIGSPETSGFTSTRKMVLLR